MTGPPEVSVSGVQLLHKPIINELRGNLVVREWGDGLPFIPKRYFVVLDVPSKEVRGDHAHRTLHQLLVCLRGSTSVRVDDGHARQEFLLDSPEYALYIPPMIWATQHHYSSTALLLVLASDPYDADEYIRNYDQFLKELADVDGNTDH